MFLDYELMIAGIECRTIRCHNLLH